MYWRLSLSKIRKKIDGEMKNISKISIGNILITSDSLLNIEFYGINVNNKLVSFFMSSKIVFLSFETKHIRQV